MDDKKGGGAPQFATAEYGGATTPPCRACGKATTGDYYQVNGARVCEACAKQIAARFPEDSHAAYARGLLFGIGGAILGFALYVACAIGTGLMIGFVSLAVGLIVGKAMIYGSGGVRGRRYQIAAVLLTYAAVSLSAVPIYISQVKHRNEHAAKSTQSNPPVNTAAKTSAAKVIGTLVLLGLASPFLDFADPVHGLIGLVILFVGIRIAWRLTGGKPATIVGPLNDGTAAT
jgi:hypothetical protein